MAVPAIRHLTNLVLINNNVKTILKIQSLVLLIGTVFAITKIAEIFLGWLRNRNCVDNCLPAVEIINPFLTVDFYVALLFSLALFLNILLLIFRPRASKKVNSEKTADAETQPVLEAKPEQLEDNSEDQDKSL